MPLSPSNVNEWYHSRFDAAQKSRIKKDKEIASKTMDEDKPLEVSNARRIRDSLAECALGGCSATTAVSYCIDSIFEQPVRMMFFFSESNVNFKDFLNKLKSEFQAVPVNDVYIFRTETYIKQENEEEALAFGGSESPLPEPSAFMNLFDNKDNIVESSILWSESKQFLFLVSQGRTSINFYVGFDQAVHTDTESISKMFKSLIHSLHKEQIHNGVFMVSTTNNGYYLSSLKINPRSLPGHCSLEDLYPSINHQKIENFFKGKYDKTLGRLMLLYGPPGNGKTSYLRHLMTNVNSSRNIVLLNTATAAQIGNPGFTDFLFKNMKSCLLVIEDAENLLMSRESGVASSGISDFLNTTDGFIGDTLDLQVIATFNTSIEKIDSALQRKGRLYHLENFRNLTMEEANIIEDKLDRTVDNRSTTSLNKKDITLAEVLNYETSNGIEAVAKPKKKVGF